MIRASPSRAYTYLSDEARLMSVHIMLVSGDELPMNYLEQGANFRELRTYELRRIPILGSSVNNLDWIQQ